MRWFVWLPILLLVLAVVATFAAGRGRDRREDPPTNEPARPGNPATEFDEAHQFPGADEDTNLQAQEASQLIGWCAQHPQTANRAQELDKQLRALSTEWKTTPDHLRAWSKRRYWDMTSSVLHDARELAGIDPDGNPVVD